MLYLLAFSLAHAAPDPRLWIGAGLAGGAGLHATPGGGGGAGVSIGVGLGPDVRRSVGLVAKVRELWMAEAVRNIGDIGLVARYPASGGPYVALGFAHQHEALLADYLAHPVAVTAGVHEAITHRTGVEVGVGWDLAAPYAGIPFVQRFSPTFGLTALVYPDGGGAPLYVLGEVGLRFGLDGIGG